jgi:hypothetical protein
MLHTLDHRATIHQFTEITMILPMSSQALPEPIWNSGSFHIFTCTPASRPHARGLRPFILT